MNDPNEAVRLMSLAYDLSQSGKTGEAEGALLAATRAAPKWSVPWYELGLLCKYAGRWAESLEHNRRAAQLDPDDEASWWNMGIAATAVGDWSAARRAWTACGITLPEGDGPPDTDFGLVPVRLEPDDAGEVVWARRMDPARARIENVPLPGTRFRWRDLVLHDGAVEGYRVVDGREVPVFNVLDRLEPSGFETFVVELTRNDDAATARLASLADELGGGAEDWGTSTNILCRDCSLGKPHEHTAAPATPANAHFGIAARNDEHAGRIIEAWLADATAADVVRWYRVDAVN